MLRKVLCLVAVVLVAIGAFGNGSSSRWRRADRAQSKTDAAIDRALGFGNSTRGARRGQARSSQVRKPAKHVQRAIDPAMARALDRLAASVLPGRLATVPEIVGAFKSAVVNVSAGTSAGTGFLVNGWLYTCAHVVKGAASVSFRNKYGVSGTVNRIYGLDEARDLALFWTGVTGHSLEFGDYSAVQTGANLVVLGTPMGLEETVTSGIVEAKRSMNGVKLLQLSAEVAPGSSGSPVFDMHGYVIGMVRSRLGAEPAYSFALGASELKGMTGVAMTELLSPPGALPETVIRAEPDRAPGIYKYGGGPTVLSGVREILLATPVLDASMNGDANLPSLFDVKQAIELKLRANRLPLRIGSEIRLESSAESAKWFGLRSAVLIVLINCIKVQDSPTYAYNISMFLTETLAGAASAGKGYSVDLWSDSRLGYAGSGVSKAAIQDAVDGLITEFSNEFLTANPGG